jgi:hypothetical protein
MAQPVLTGYAVPRAVMGMSTFSAVRRRISYPVYSRRVSLSGTRRKALVLPGLVGGAEDVPEQGSVYDVVVEGGGEELVGVGILRLWTCCQSCSSTPFVKVSTVSEKETERCFFFGSWLADELGSTEW